MRSFKLRSAARWGTMMAIAGGMTLAAAEAHAATGTGVNTSVGNVSLKYEHTKGMNTSIQTGFLGPSFAKINVGMKIDPVANNGPLFVIDMPRGAQVLASWGNDKRIVLSAQNGNPIDGLVKVRHTLTPSVDFKFSGFGLNATFSYNANDLLNKIPGAKFNFDSQATQQFAPWGFAPVETKLNAPDVQNAVLFSMNMNVLPDMISNNVTGTFGVRATTKPTFTYKTTKIALSGVADAITAAGAEVSVDAVDGDYMDVMTAVEGEMNVKGALAIQPFVHIDTVLQEYNLNTDFGISVLNFDYTVPNEKVNFQTVLVHIPLPNVKVPSRNIDLGDVSSGDEKSKTVSIENTGEKEAVMTFKSSDSQFSVPGDTITVPPKSKYDLKVKFSPSSEGAASSDITVSSSDPDSPEQTFKIGANGADLGPNAEQEEEDLPTGAADSGCGCKTAGSSSSSVPSWAGLGLAGLGAVVLFRRRRTTH